MEEKHDHWAASTPNNVLAIAEKSSASPSPIHEAQLTCSDLPEIVSIEFYFVSNSCGNVEMLWKCISTDFHNISTDFHNISTDFHNCGNVVEIRVELCGSHLGKAEDINNSIL